MKGKVSSTLYHYLLDETLGLVSNQRMSLNYQKMAGLFSLKSSPETLYLELDGTMIHLQKKEKRYPSGTSQAKKLKSLLGTE